MSRAVITGIGVVSPLASSLTGHRARLAAGESGVIPRDADDALAACWAPAYDARMSQSISNRMLRKLLQPTAAMAVVAAGEAIVDAGLQGHSETLEAMHLYLASVSFDVPPSQFVPALEVSLDEKGDFDVSRFATRGIPQIDPLLIVKSLPNAGLCAIAIEHGVLGPNLNISSGASGGAQALAMAARAIELGESEAAMAGAYDSLLQPEHVVAEALRGRSAAPGEGAVVFVLESEERARSRGVRPYACVAAAHESFDSLEAAAASALEASGLRPQRVFGDLCGPEEDDVRERAIARRLLGDDAVLESAAASIGSTGAAAGLFSSTHAALRIRERELRDAVVWRSDGGARNVALVLTEAR